MAQVCATHEPDTWITQYKRCLADGLLPLDPMEARKIKKNSSKFTMIDGEFYRFGFTHPLLECVHGEKCARIMAELREGICGSHVGGQALAARTLRAGYYWPTMRENFARFLRVLKFSLSILVVQSLTWASERDRPQRRRSVFCRFLR